MELISFIVFPIFLIWLCLKYRSVLKATLIFVAIWVGLAATFILMSERNYDDRQARLRQQTKPVEYYHYYEPNPNGAKR